MHLPEIVAKLREKGCRHTPLREALLRILLALPHGATAPELLHSLEKAGLRVNKTTLYRQLEFLAAEHIVRTAPGKNGAMRYEIQSGHHHHHFRCTVPCIDRRGDGGGGEGAGKGAAAACKKRTYCL